MVAGTISIRWTLAPVDGKAIINDPKTAGGRRSIALDPVAIEALRARIAAPYASGELLWTPAPS